MKSFRKFWQLCQLWKISSKFFFSIFGQFLKKCLKFLRIWSYFVNFLMIWKILPKCLFWIYSLRIYSILLQVDSNFTPKIIFWIWNEKIFFLFLKIFSRIFLKNLCRKVTQNPFQFYSKRIFEMFDTENIFKFGKFRKTFKKFFFSFGNIFSNFFDLLQKWFLQFLIILSFEVSEKNREKRSIFLKKLSKKSYLWVTIILKFTPILLQKFFLINIFFSKF